MKRSSLTRRTGLKRGAWLKRGGYLAGGKPAGTLTPPGRRLGLSRGSRRTIGTANQRSHFRDVTIARAPVCPVLDDGPCDGPLQAHHVVPQEKIKQRAAAWRLDDAATAVLLWDPRNGLAVCRRHHDRHTLAARRLPASAIPATARVFADALGLGYLLDTTYRPKETDDHAS